MAWMLFEIGINAYQALLMVTFLRAQMIPKGRIGYKEVLCFAAITACFTAYLFWDIPVSDTIIFAFPLLYAFTAFQNKWLEKIFWVLILAVIMLTVMNVSIVFFSVAFSGQWNDLMNERTPVRFVFIIVSNVLMTLVLFYAHS